VPVFTVDSLPERATWPEPPELSRLPTVTAGGLAGAARPRHPRGTCAYAPPTLPLPCPGPTQHGCVSCRHAADAFNEHRAELARSRALLQYELRGQTTTVPYEDCSLERHVDDFVQILEHVEAEDGASVFEGAFAGAGAGAGSRDRRGTQASPLPPLCLSLPPPCLSVSPCFSVSLSLSLSAPLLPSTRCQCRQHA